MDLKDRFLPAIYIYGAPQQEIMVVPLVILAIALLVLAKSSQFAVRYAVRFSKAAGINQLVVGFLLLAISTSLPELVVTVFSSLEGEGLLGMGTLIGSSFGDISLILGIAALTGFAVTKRDKQDMEYSIIIAVIMAAFMIALQALDAAYGIFAVLVFVVYMQFIVKQGVPVKEKIKGLRSVEALKAALLVLVSVAVLVVSARFVVDAAVDLSRIAGIPEAAIGATVIAFGSFLPELSLTIVAMRRKNVELALGNLAGSLVTNLALIVGLGVLIHPIVLNGVSHLNLGIFIAANIIVFALMQKARFGRKDAAVLFAMYAIFVGATVWAAV